MDSGIRRAAIYSRKSKFTGKGESIGNQIELCRRYLSAGFSESCAKAAVVYEDEGFSGGDTNRPAFRRMMESARAGELDAVIVYRLDRISRNISDFTALVQELEHLNVAFISVREQFDTATPMGRAMMYISSVFSQLERETIAERIRDNMRELSRTGRWLGGALPTGYTSERDIIGGKQRSRLKQDTKEIECVLQIFSVFLKTESLSATQREIMRRGFRTKNKKCFSRFSIKAILQNPVYMRAEGAARDYFVRNGAEVCSTISDFDGKRGIMAYNRTKQKKGSAAKHNPICMWIIAVGEHEGAVRAEDWIKVQEILKKSAKIAEESPKKANPILTGLIYCSCGSRMYAKRHGQSDRYSYVCRRKESSKKRECAVRNANGNELDEEAAKKACGLEYVRVRIKKVIWNGEKAEIILHSEDSKCYPLADAFMVSNQYPQSKREPKWRILSQVSENIYILCSTSDGYVRYAPMYIHSFRLIAPRKLLEAQLFNQQYQNYEDIPNVQDRLRWCRHHMGLMQKEVAELIGITRGHYIDFEVGYVDHYPKEIVDKLAELYQVPVDDLLDDYNRFLYKGQGKLIQEYRRALD